MTNQQKRELMQFLRGHPTADNERTARLFRCSPQTVKNYKKTVRDQGAESKELEENAE